MLSKSQYIRGLQCHKSLWLYKHRPELREQPNTQTQSRFEVGHTVGELACQLFPGGSEIKFTPNDFDGMIAETKKLIEDGITVIYEATFKERGIFLMADILVKEGNAWNIYEVKSSTQVKASYLDDTSVQWHALSNVIQLNKAHIVHINNQYVRRGSLNIHKLFHIEDITEIVQAKQSQVADTLMSLENMLISGLEPSMDIGLHCHSPYDCDFQHYCWKDVPTPSVFNLYRMSGQRKFELYHSGIVGLKDILLDDLSNETQTVQALAALSKNVHVQPEIIQEFLDTLEYPLNFFDFETFQEAIPRFNGQRPYMQMPFQYSLHVVPEVGQMVHKEFLGYEHSDPREELIQKMLKDLTPSGSIVAYNMAFEKRMISEMAQSFPQYADELLALNDRFVDLIVPFRKLGYYHPDFNGSFSIKSVLPAMFPNDKELDYKSLEIQDGGMAMETFANLHLLKDQTNRDEIRSALLAYCHLDTLAMVKIHKKLTQIT